MVEYRYSESIIAGVCRNRIDEHRDKNCLVSHFDNSGRKTSDLHRVTWGELGESIKTNAKGLLQLGIEPFDKIALLGPNTPHWITTVYGIISLRCTFVPLYPSSKKEDVFWCLYDSSAKAVFCHSQEHLNKVLSVRDRLPSLKWIIVMDPDVKTNGTGVYSFSEILSAGVQYNDGDEKIEALVRKSKEDDLTSIIYTSGTTGKPKGVMLTNSNFVSQRVATEPFDFNSDDVWLAHLPLCHTLGFSSDLLNAGYQGGTLFVADSVETAEMRANLAACRPTVMTSVPRLWEKLYLQIDEIVGKKPHMVQNIFHWAMSVGKERFSKQNASEPIPFGLRAKSKIAGRVFNKVKKQAGLERLRISITGGGPIHPDLLEFFGAMGITIYQGYGLTETAPVTHVSTPKDNKIGWIGKPISGTDCKIADDGELLIKGPQVMKGYLNNKEATEEAFTNDGFFMTGDVAKIDKNGFVQITDRKKELIITSGGKNIAPQPIQNAFNTDRYIEQVYVVGDARKYIAALIIPNFEALEVWAGKKGVEYNNRKDLVRNEKVRELMQRSVDKANAALAKHETIKRFQMLENEFSEKSGELTPTLKVKRKVVEEKYKDIINSLYPDDDVFRL